MSARGDCDVGRYVLEPGVGWFGVEFIVETVTVAEAVFPVPMLLVPVTEYVVVLVGITVPLLPVKLMPVHAKEVAAGLQFATKVEVEPELIEVDDAVNVHDGA